jgi:anti-anti-sigma factor
MKVSVINNDTTIITLEGNLTNNNEKELNGTLSAAINNKATNIILNFSLTEHVNSDGIGILVKLAVLAKQKSARLYAVGLDDFFSQIFKLTGIDEGITVIEENNKPVNLSTEEFGQLHELTGMKGNSNNTGWAPFIERLKVTERPESAMMLNMNNRRVLGPFQGFGPMWQKTYSVTINKPELKPEDVITIMKQHFPEFQPSQNKFYPTSQGIKAGEPVFIDSVTPGGMVSTGVLVLYSDDVSFTLMTPQGHPEAGWVTFSAKSIEKSIEMQIQGLVRSADPFYELAFRMVGSKFQETIWKHVLASLANYMEVDTQVQMTKQRIAPDFQWSKIGNIYYNAQLRSLPYNIPYLLRKFRKSGKENK